MGISGCFWLCFLILNTESGKFTLINIYLLARLKQKAANPRCAGCQEHGLFQCPPMRVVIKWHPHSPKLLLFDFIHPHATGWWTHVLAREEYKEGKGTKQNLHDVLIILPLFSMSHLSQRCLEYFFFWCAFMFCIMYCPMVSFFVNAEFSCMHN